LSNGEPPPASPRSEAELREAIRPRISTDPADLDIDWIHEALSKRAYWALGRSRDQVVRSLEHSISFGAFIGARQVGIARVVTDHVTFGWICDVFVEETERGRGIGGRLMDAIVADPRLAGVRRLALSTRDASEVYLRHGGFRPLGHPERWMERRTDGSGGS
jgi:GNAT superfamily N-acetyltransferase